MGNQLAAAAALSTSPAHSLTLSPNAVVKSEVKMSN